MEGRLRLSQALNSRYCYVPIQATYRAEAEPAELQCPNGQAPGWREGHEQAHRAWYTCPSARDLSVLNGLGNGYLVLDFINKPPVQYIHNYLVHDTKYVIKLGSSVSLLSLSMFAVTIY